MPRRHRVIGAGMTYHVTAHGVDGTVLYIDDADRYRYLTLLAKVKHTHAGRIFAYVLMSNHLHLVVQTSLPNLSSLIQALHGRYGTEFNRKHTREGHLFSGRFWARPLESNEDLLQATCYVHVNPVRAGVVKTPEGYPWSSFASYLAETPEGTLVDVGPVLDLLAQNRNQARSAYLSFVQLAAVASSIPAGDGRKAGTMMLANPRGDTP